MEIAKSLGRIEDGSTIQLLEIIADDPDFEVRFNAFAALSKKGEIGLEAIKNFSKKYPEMSKEFTGRNVC